MPLNKFYTLIINRFYYYLRLLFNKFVKNKNKISDFNSNNYHY